MRTRTVANVCFDVVVLNGGSSSGKSSIARRLQDLLPPPWLRLGVDDLLAALAPGAASGADPSLIEFADDGSVSVGPLFGRVEAAWNAGLATMARAGVGVIVEDVFLDGQRSQARIAAAFGDLRTLWVGVHCDPDVAERREAGRAERVSGMAHRQALAVHHGVRYDVEVDTTATGAEECARTVAARLG